MLDTKPGVIQPSPASSATAAPSIATPSKAEPAAPLRASAEPRRYRQWQSAGARYRDRAPIRGQADALREKGLYLALDDPRRIAERAARKAGRAPGVDLTEKVATLAAMPAVSLAAAMERVIDKNDLLPAAYLPRGDQIGHAVGRVVTVDDQGRDISYGTAFLVAPDIVLTNHHVLPDATTAGASKVQFNYQFGTDGQMEHIVTARIDAARYFTNEELDFTLAGVTFAPGDKRPPAWLPLIASDAKIVNDEPVTIVQHANAQPKQVALRNNKVVDLLPSYLHYTTDTEPGASGSPVFNDQWEVVALHHAGVPRLDANGQILAADGKPWDASTGDDAIQWIANEGIRISKIVACLKSQTDLPPAIRQMIASLTQQENAMPLAAAPQANARPASASVLFDTPERQGGDIASAATPKAAPFTTAAPTSPASPAIQQAAAGMPVSLVLPPASPCEITIRLQPAGMPAAESSRATEGLLANAANAAMHTISTAADWISGAQTTSSPFITALNDGDVLLYNGTGIVSDAIKFFTNSDVSHAALYLGARENQMIGEAIDTGLVRDTRDQSFPGHNWVVVHRLRTPGDMAPVLNRADDYLGQHLKYAYQQIVLLAVLLLVKQVRPSGMLGKVVQQVCAAAAEALNEFLQNGKQLMICSEFVYRAYDEAAQGAGSPYRLQVPGIALESYAPTGALPPGVAPNSLLAKLARNPDLLTAGFRNAKESMTAATLPLDQEQLQRQAKQTVAEYLAEQRYGRPPAMIGAESTVPDTQVAAAVARFAITLAAARHRSATGSSPQEALAQATQESVTLGQLPPALQNLFRTPADLVTPADLRKSPSLVEVGRVF